MPGDDRSHERPYRVKSREFSTVDAQLQGRLLTLLPLHRVGDHAERPPPAPLALHGDASAPAMLLRVGKTDHRPVVELIGAPLEPAAVLVALTEQRGVIAAAGQAAREAGARFGVDPVFFRCTLADFRATRTFANLSYTPALDIGHWRDLSQQEWRQLARLAIEEQAHRHHDLLVGTTVVIAGPDDPAIQTACVLLDASIAARMAWGTDPLLAPLIVDLAAFEDARSQIKLVRRVQNVGRPEAFLVHVHRLHPGARPGRIAAALRLLLLLEQAAAPVFLAKAGTLRRLVAAYDLAGYEAGLGRFDRFDLGDFTGKGGGGVQPSKIEIPSLLTALPADLAREALRAGVLPEPPELHDPLRWNARVLAEQAGADAQRTPAQRRTALRQDLEQGGRLAAELKARGIDVHRHVGALRTWPTAMDLADAWGLHDRARLQASLAQAA